MNILKKIISIFLVVVVLSTTFLVPIAKAEAITVTTVVGVAAVVAAAAACGYVIANHGDFSAAASAFADDFIRIAGDSWNTLRVTATAGGKVIAHWGSQLWNMFTNWLRGVISGENAIEYGGMLTAIPTAPTGFVTIPLNYNTWGPATGNFQTRFDVGPNVLSVRYALGNGYLTSGSTFYKAPWEDGFTLSPHLYLINGAIYYCLALIGSNQVQSGAFTQYYVNGNLVRFTRDSAGRICANGTPIATGFPTVTDYIASSVGAGDFIGSWSDLGWGQDVINPGSTNPRVGIDEGANTLGDVGSMPVDIPIGQEVQIPIAGDWVNPGLDDVGHVTREGDVVLTGDDVIDVSRDTFVPTEDDYISDQIPETTDFPYPSDITDGVQDGTDVVPVPTTITDETDIPIQDTIDIPIDTDIDIDDATDIPDTDTFPDNPPAEDTQTNTNRMKLSQIIVQKFPFCLPFDLYNSVRMMVAEPEAPVLNWKFKFPFLEHFEQDFEFDFSIFETLASVVRWFLSAIFIVGLIFVTKKIIWK